MKNLYFLNGEEKDRILNLHESATKRQYLSEQGFNYNDPLGMNAPIKDSAVQGPAGDPYQYMKWGDKFWYAKKSEGNTPNWIEVKTPKGIESVKSKIYAGSPSTSTSVKSPNNKIPTSRKKSSIDTTNIDKNLYAAQKDTFKDTFKDTLSQKTVDRDIKGMENLKKQIGTLSKRTNQQLQSMRKKGQLKNDSFIIVNKSSAIASLFGPNYKFITNSSITTGMVKDTGVENKPDNTSSGWLKMSTDYAKKNPTTKEGTAINNWLNKYKNKIGLINNDRTVNYPVYLTLAGLKSVEEFPFSYDARAQSGGNITPSGTFGISSGQEEKGYAGAGNDNTFPLIQPDSVGEITPAIHGYATTKRGEYIKQASKQGKDVNKEYTRAGAGCINVTPNFLTKMRELKPSYVIILPDTGGVVDIKITTFENFKIKLTQLGSKCVRSLSQMFA